MKILSIDSGVEKTGYAVFENNTYLTSGLIKTDKSLSLPERLSMIHRFLEQIINKHQPEVIILEQIFFFRNKKTIVSVSQSQGVILFLASQKKIRVEYLTPLQIKQAITGYGRADKKSLQKMLSFQGNIALEKKDDDETDAIACALAYYYLHKNEFFH
jgi:crossover junction endodeoxyribonuclease RuvC